MPHVVNRRFPFGKSTYLDVLVKYSAIYLTARLCRIRGLFPKRAHLCTAIDISDCVDP